MPEQLEREREFLPWDHEEPRESRVMYDKTTPVGEVPGEEAERQLGVFIAKRAEATNRETGETREQREARRYREMTEAQEREAREARRHQWVAFHRAQAKRWRATLEEMIRHHEEQAEKYSNLPIGA